MNKPLHECQTRRYKFFFMWPEEWMWGEHPFMQSKGYQAIFHWMYVFGPLNLWKFRNLKHFPFVIFWYGPAYHMGPDFMEVGVYWKPNPKAADGDYRYQRGVYFRWRRMFWFGTHWPKIPAAVIQAEGEK